jgi:hypothetical protein
MKMHLKVDKAGDNEAEECAWVPAKVSFRLPRNFGPHKATQNWGQPLTNKILWSALVNQNSVQPLYKCTEASFQLNTIK